MSNDLNLGEILKNTRESLKITIEEASHHLKVKAKDIIAIEENAIHLLTHHFYFHGFVKSYGKFLRIKDDLIEDCLKNIAQKCNTKNKKHQLINLDGDQNKKPSRDDLINAILIFTMIYLLLISFSQFKTQNLAITDLIVNQLGQID